MNTFATSGTAACSPQDALKSALATLTSNGFAITRRDATSATLTGPGLNSSRQNPLLGASRIDLRIDNKLLQVNAELGGIDTMRRFLMWFPFLLGLGLGLVFVVIGGVVGQQSGLGFGVPGAQGWRWALTAMVCAILSVAPWLVLSPVMARMFRNRTQRALETLVNNATFAEGTA
jgi:hypothetical protein